MNAPLLIAQTPAPPSEGSWLLLILFAGLALLTSFVCSLCEAGILSLPEAHASWLAKKGRASGRMLEAMKQQIDRPLNAILTLNTIANTVGSIGVGAQAAELFDDIFVGIASGVMTYLVLVFGELIPKKLGATYSRPLAPAIAYLIRSMEIFTRPIIIFTKPITMLMDRALDRVAAAEQSTVSRETLGVIAELGSAEGSLNPAESQIIQNLMKLNVIRVSEVMTPRTAVFMLPQTQTVRESMAHARFTQFTRIPLTGENTDDVTGIVVKGNLYESYVKGDIDRPLTDFRRPIHKVWEGATLLQVLEEFARVGHHIYLAVDEFGGTAGVVTLEDVLEAILGQEIIDETDRVADMRAMAERIQAAKRHAGSSEA
ncbi:MAG: hemolysin family protein [Planctomycetota bacterium]